MLAILSIPDWKIKTSSYQPSTGVVVWQIMVYNLQLLDWIRLIQNNNNGTEKEREPYDVLKWPFKTLYSIYTNWQF